MLIDCLDTCAPQAELDELYQRSIIVKAKPRILEDAKDVLADVLVGPNWLWMRDRVPLCNPMLILDADDPVSKTKDKRCRVLPSPPASRGPLIVTLPYSISLF